MANTALREMRWSDGQVILEGDLNDAQRFMRSLVLDGIVGNRIRSPSGFGGAPSSALSTALYSLANGGAPVCHASDALKITVRAGMLFQWLGSSGVVEPGADAQLVPFHLLSTDLSFTHAVGNGANPRIDGVFVKIEYENTDNQMRDFEDATTHAVSSQAMDIKRRSKLTSTIVAGTPAATPAAPATPAGYVRLYDVLVPTSHNAVFVAATHLRDHRLPVPALASPLVSSIQMVPIGLGTWGLNTDGFHSSGAGAEVLYAFLPGGGNGRLVALAFGVDGSGNIDVDLVRREIGGAGAPAADTVLASNLGNPGSNTGDWQIAPPATLPVWSHGYNCSQLGAPSSGDQMGALALRFTSSAAGDIVRWARFYVMGEP